MHLDPVALSTLAAVVQLGTFERAAASLQVTPSAVSQRIRTLEQSIGQVLVSRTKPTIPTPAGHVLLRLAGQWELLLADALAELLPEASDTAYPQVPIVVNADSLATWILPGLAQAQSELGITLNLIREDEEHASDLVRQGTALAAVTADPRPVAGCQISALGALRYVAVCTPDFHRTWFSQGLRGSDLDRAPMIRFDVKDTMQHRIARRWVRREIDPPTTFIPSTREFGEAVQLGMGWALLPWDDAGPLIETGDLVSLTPRITRAIHDVPLYWLEWKLPSRTLTTLSRCIREQASRTLR